MERFYFLRKCTKCMNRRMDICWAGYLRVLGKGPPPPLGWKPLCLVYRSLKIWMPISFIYNNFSIFYFQIDCV